MPQMMRLPGRQSSFSRRALSSFIVKATHGFYIRLKKTFKSKRFISLTTDLHFPQLGGITLAQRLYALHLYLSSAGKQACHREGSWHRRGGCRGAPCRHKGRGAGQRDMPCTVGQHSLEILLYPAPCTASFGTSKVSCTGGTPQNKLAYVGEMQLKDLD